MATISAFEKTIKLLTYEKDGRCVMANGQRSGDYIKRAEARQSVFSSVNGGKAGDKIALKRLNKVMRCERF